MTPFTLPFHADLRALPPGVLLWPLLFGLGASLVLTAQPIGRPKPDLRERLRRLDVDERLRMEFGRRDRRSIFASRLLDAMLGPAIEDLGRLLRTGLGRLGVGSGRDLERKLAVARPGVEPIQLLGEKAVAGLIGFAVFPLMNVFGIAPFGAWPVWLWLVGLLGGFLLPDVDLDRRLEARRIRLVMELPVLLDLLTIATSAGLALEQALGVVARQSHGAVAQEFQHVVRELALGQGSVVEALEGMAERNAVPELTALVGQLRAAHQQGIPLTQTLAAQAEALREHKRLRVVAEGGKASVKMLLPVALFILPVLFVVLLAPAAVELLGLGG